MRRVLHWMVVVVVVAHGLIHLLAAAKGFGWADVSQLTAPISPAMGAVKRHQERAACGPHRDV